MKRIAGYTLFWISVGMLIALLIANTFWNVLLIFVLLNFIIEKFCDCVEKQFSI